MRGSTSRRGPARAAPLGRVVGWTALWGAAVWVLAAVGGLRRPPEVSRELGTPARAAVVAGSSAVLTVVAVAQRLLVHQDSTGTLDAITNLTPLDVLLGVATLVASTAAVVLLTCEHARTRTQTAP